MLSALCHVGFHITGGQKVECIYPPLALGDDDLAAVAFHSFPDSLKFQQQTGTGVFDSTFSFRLRRPSNREDFIYGFVYCHQRYDSGLPRGGEQVSVVALSSLYLPNVFIPLVRQAGPTFLLYGNKALESLYVDASKWPAPRWGVGAVAALKLGNDFLHVGLPSITSFPPEEVGQAVALSGYSTHIQAIEAEKLRFPGLDIYKSLPPSTDMDVYTPFAHCLKSLWHKWEMVLVGEPLMIMAPTPHLSSSTVHALLTLTAPYPYGHDFSPYFTVHDPSFPTLASGIVPTQTSKNLPLLLGITNPQIKERLFKWPNTIVTGFDHLNSKKSSRNWLVAMLSSGDELKDTIQTSYKACISPDLDLINTLMLSSKRSGMVKREPHLHTAYQFSLQLQQHFRELTSAALRPLLINDEALRSPITFRDNVLSGNVSVADNLLARFKNRKLLAHFYERWLRSPSLLLWLHLQHAKSDATVDISIDRGK